MTGRADRRSAERRKSQRRAVNALNLPNRVIFPGGSQGSGELIGYAIEAADGPIGRVADLCIEAESSVVTEIVVSARRRLLPTRKRIFVPLNAIERIDRLGRKIYLRPTRAQLRVWSKRRPQC